MAYTQKVEGPTLVTPPTPPKPKEYYSCEGCIHFHLQRKTRDDHSIGTNVHKVCHHPIMVVGKTMSLDTPENTVSDSVTVTPSHCPYLRDRS